MDSTEIQISFGTDDWLPLGSGHIEVRPRVLREERVAVPGGEIGLRSEIVFDPKARQFVLASLLLESGSEHRPGVTARAMREIQLGELMQDTTDLAVRSSFEGEVHYADYWFDNPRPALGRSRPDVIRDAAHIWALAHLTSRPENASVAAYLGVSVSSAKRYLLEPGGAMLLVELVLG